MELACAKLIAQRRARSSTKPGRLERAGKKEVHVVLKIDGSRIPRNNRQIPEPHVFRVSFPFFLLSSSYLHSSSSSFCARARASPAIRAIRALQNCSLPRTRGASSRAIFPPPPPPTSPPWENELTILFYLPLSHPSRFIFFSPFVPWAPLFARSILASCVIQKFRTIRSTCRENSNFRAVWLYIINTLKCGVQMQWF